MALLFMLLYMLVLPVVNGNFTLPSRLSSTDIGCIDECYFFTDNQTVTIINITEPKKAVLGVAYYKTPIRMRIQPQEQSHLSTPALRFGRSLRGTMRRRM